MSEPVAKAELNILPPTARRPAEKWEAPSFQPTQEDSRPAFEPTRRDDRRRGERRAEDPAREPREPRAPREQREPRPRRPREPQAVPPPARSAETSPLARFIGWLKNLFSGETPAATTAPAGQPGERRDFDPQRPRRRRGGRGRQRGPGGDFDPRERGSRPEGAGGEGGGYPRGDRPDGGGRRRRRGGRSRNRGPRPGGEGPGQQA